MEAALKELESFIEKWEETSERNKTAFVELKNHLLARKDIRVDFVARKGVTYSLRASHPNQSKRPLFVMIDVIEDEPRWLSVCFYGEMISDPEEQGDFVPGGLLGEDAICFDIEAFDADMLLYLKDRLDEASASASGQ
jgi:hypothetical protein